MRAERHGVDRHSGGKISLPSEVLEWAREQLKKEAARFPARYTEELKAELAATLAELKQHPPSGIRAWKAYLFTAFRNRALTLVDKWRAQERREKSLDAETPEPPVGFEEADLERLENRLELAGLRSKLDAHSYGLLMLLAATNENKSRVAWLLGTHRNTIRRRLQKIRRMLRECPIENVSGTLVPIQPQPSAALQLEAEQWEQLADLAQDSRRRGAFKARLILALASGQSYTQIQRRLKTTAPTISRWKHRFEKDGIAGLKTRHQGRTSLLNARPFEAKWWRALRRRDPLQRSLSCRHLAKELDISKSTAHRFLKAGRA